MNVHKTCFTPLFIISESCLALLNYIPTTNGKAIISNCDHLGFIYVSVPECARQCCEREGCNAVNFEIDDNACNFKSCQGNLAFVDYYRKVIKLAYRQLLWYNFYHYVSLWINHDVKLWFCITSECQDEGNIINWKHKAHSTICANDARKYNYFV